MNGGCFVGELGGLEGALRGVQRVRGERGVVLSIGGWLLWGGCLGGFGGQMAMMGMRRGFEGEGGFRGG